MGKFDCYVRGENFPWDAGDTDMPVIPPPSGPTGHLIDGGCCYFPFYSNSHLGWASGNATDGDGIYAVTYDGISNWRVGGICADPVHNLRFYPKYNVTRASGDNEIKGVFGIDGNTCGLVYTDRVYVVKFDYETSSASVTHEYDIGTTWRGDWVKDTEYGYALVGRRLMPYNAVATVDVYNKATGEVNTFGVLYATQYLNNHVVALGSGYMALQGRYSSYYSNIHLYKFSDQSTYAIPNSAFMEDTPSTGWLFGDKLLYYTYYKGAEVSLTGGTTEAYIPSYANKAFYHPGYRMPVFGYTDGFFAIETSYYKEELHTDQSIYDISDCQDFLYFPIKNRCILAFAGAEEDGVHETESNLIVYTDIPAYGDYSCYGGATITVSSATPSLEKRGIPDLSTASSDNPYAHSTSWPTATASDTLTFTHFS